jgi:two-component system, cell cycle sensor histidine kinase and response regulator CckA
MGANPNSTHSPTPGDQPEVAHSLQFLYLATLIALVVSLALTKNPLERGLLAIAFTGVGLALVCNWRGFVNWGARLAVSSVLLTASLLSYTARDGFRSIAILIFPVSLVVAALLLEGSWYLGFTALALAIVGALGGRELYAVSHGAVIVRSQTTTVTVLQVECILMVTAAAAGILGRSLRRSLRRNRDTIVQLDGANQELQESERRYRSLIELAVDGIFITDSAGKILDVNNRAATLTGYSKEELLGMELARIFSSGAAKPLAIQSLGLDSSDSSDLPHITQAEAVCLDGSKVAVELNSKTMPDGVVQIFCRDITERLRTEERIQRMQKLESLGRLAGGVAHDFNNLLTVINGYSALLLRNLPQGDRSRVAAREIHTAGENAAALTQQLLAFSRTQVSNPQPVDLNALVESSRNMLRRLLREDIELAVKYSPDAGATLADPSQVQQVLVNLAVNARDAMPEGGRLVIETSRITAASLQPGFLDSHPDLTARAYTALAVTDNGVGMTEHVRKNMFEPFFTTKDEGKGTGLGLSTVYGIIHQYNGFIDVRSAPGRGSTFLVCFPAYEDKSVPEPKPAPVFEESHRGSETLLVVEDREGVREYTVAVLNSAGYRTLQAASGVEALKLLESGSAPIDVLLTDMVMPRMNGQQLAEKVRGLRPKVKVIFITGYSGNLLNADNLPDASFSMLEKPFSPSQLVTAVREALDGKARASAARG